MLSPQATAEANNLAALAMALDQYNREMEDLVGGEKPYLAEDKFKEAHYKTYDAALELFRSTKKMGGELYSKQFEEKLQEQLKESFEHFEEQNASKNIFSAARTPAVLFSFIVCFYILSGLFDMVGITVVSSMMTWGMGVAILLLILWSYVRFSGKYREAGQYIDSMVNTIWEQVCMYVHMYFDFIVGWPKPNVYVLCIVGVLCREGLLCVSVVNFVCMYSECVFSPQGSRLHTVGEHYAVEGLSYTDSLPFIVYSVSSAMRKLRNKELVFVV